MSGFGRALRLRKSRDFDRVQRGGVQRGGARFHGRYVVIVHAPNNLGSPRFGLAVSRKVGNAVVRNRVKRWIRESVRASGGSVGPIDVVIVARSSAATAGLAAVSAEIGRAFETLPVRAGA